MIPIKPRTATEMRGAAATNGAPKMLQRESPVADWTVSEVGELQCRIEGEFPVGHHVLGAALTLPLRPEGVAAARSDLATTMDRPVDRQHGHAVIEREALRQPRDRRLMPVAGGTVAATHQRRGRAGVGRQPEHARHRSSVPVECELEQSLTT
ncbi:MAG: hypothetical protein R2710_18865 [Acidimicrobiales bacterium]